MTRQSRVANRAIKREAASVVFTGSLLLALKNWFVGDEDAEVKMDSVSAVLKVITMASTAM